METLFAVFIGVGLSAAAGFRVFTPLLLTNIASKLSFITLVDGFEWLSSTSATIAFSIALILEIIAYYIPVIDNVVKLMATPLALGAGTLLTASFIGDMDPFITWGISLIAGGGTASLTQVASGALRGTSTLVTGGVGNFIVTMLEGVFALIITVSTFLMPVLALVVVGLILVVLFQLNKRRDERRQPEVLPLKKQNSKQNTYSHFE